MTAPILYSDTAAIRAAVGVKEKEIPDSYLTDQNLEMQVRTGLHSWLPTYATLYATGASAGATDDERYVTDLLVAYSMFYGAVRVVEMIMAMRLSVGDGKAEMTRFNVKWSELLEMMRARLSETEDALKDILDMGSSGTDYFGSAVPNYDPVANT